MKFLRFVKRKLPGRVRSWWGGRPDFAKFEFGDPLSVRNDIRQKYGFHGDLLDIFVNNKTNAVHKWHHYIPIYDRYFARFRGRKVRFLEIGVFQGGSLQMWREYFGKDAIIYGVDINPDCKRHNGSTAQVRIGSQADAAFLASVIDEMGGVDIVLDDGSHQMNHIIASLNCLFPRLSSDGLYMVEDLHTAYWRDYGGGYRSRSSFFAFVMDLIDDLHKAYHFNARRQPAVSNKCTGIHIHDSIVVLEAGQVQEPTRSSIS